MDYKIIKNLNPRNEKFNNGTEMSKDGKTLRMVGTTTTITIDGPESRAALIAEDGTSKEFGVRTLYRKSWGKAYPGTESTAIRVPKKPKEMTEKQKLRAKAREIKQAAKDERAKRRALKASFKTRKGKLLSGFNHARFVEALEYSKKKRNSFNQYQDKKIFIKSIINKGDIHLIRIETQSTKRTGRFFYNIENEKFIEFNPEAHKLGYGNDAIVWPALA